VSIIRIGSNSKYASGWESAFGKGATAKKDGAKKKAAAPKKKAAKKGKK
jgi:hypothetical protein